jgi:MOSC domain-containing protein YiiM
MTLVTLEGIDQLVSQGFPLFPGALGENLTTRGLDRRILRIGQRLQVGEAEIELTQIRAPCATLDVYGHGIQAAMYDARVLAGDTSSPLWGLSGFYASVRRSGTIRPADTLFAIEHRTSQAPNTAEATVRGLRISAACCSNARPSSTTRFASDPP